MAADNLAGKMAEVMAVVGNVPKTGKNKFHNYSFVQESDLVDAIRPELAKRGIITLPRVVDDEVRVVPGKNGDQIVTRLTLELDFTDGTDTFTTRVVGDGLDGQDKGPYKALTGAIKYALLKTFLVGTGDDPEHDRGHGGVRVSPEEDAAIAADARAQAGQNPMSVAQKKFLDDLAEQCIAKNVNIEAVLKAAGVPAPSTKAEASKAIQALQEAVA